MKSGRRRSSLMLWTMLSVLKTLAVADVARRGGAWGGGGGGDSMERRERSLILDI